MDQHHNDEVPDPNAENQVPLNDVNQAHSPSAPLGQNSDAEPESAQPLQSQQPQDNEPESNEQQEPHQAQETGQPQESQSHQSPPTITTSLAEEDQRPEDPNTSTSSIPAVARQFTTPSKSLPPLKDIEHIVTPKSFGVAKDTTHFQPEVRSSPVAQPNSIQLQQLAEAEEDAFDATANDTFGHQGFDKDSNTDAVDLEAASTFLDVDPSALLAAGDELVAKVAQRAGKFQGLQSELSFFKLNQEQINQVQSKKVEELQRKLEAQSAANKTLESECEEYKSETARKDELLASLRHKNTSISERLHKLESTISETESTRSIESGNKDQEIYRLNNTINELTRTNIELGSKLSELTKELNESTNEKFASKLESSKATSELQYIKNQKDWYESQLKSVQEKYTELIKLHETEFLKDSNKISSLSTQNDNLASMNKTLTSRAKELEAKLEKATSTASDLESKLELQSSQFSKSQSTKDDTIELLNVQLSERTERISQLEHYSSELKQSMTDNIGSLQAEIDERDDKIAHLEEKLRRTEEALDSELHKETELPKLAPSAEMILQESNSGISLSALYTEFNHIKKELVLERAQKDKLAGQLQHFVAELESKKPAIANYRNQIQYYEESMTEMHNNVEAIRVDKVESEKECNRLRSRLSSYETELGNLKQLSKDLGRQLCFYLIHSKIRDDNENPLTIQEKKIIEQILVKSGNKDGVIESDTDQLITERLIGFANVIELQKKNEELVVAVRSLGKQLEEKDDESNGLEAAAIEEAKDAIITLQNELDSVSLKYVAACKERDLLKSLDVGNTSINTSKIGSKATREFTEELKLKASESEKALQKLQSESRERISELNAKLGEANSKTEELKLKLATSKHSVELAESRLDNLDKLLQNSKKEAEFSRKENAFWKEQAAKQEALLVSKSNELRDLEKKLFEFESNQTNLRTERDVLQTLQSNLKEEISHLKKDKEQLSAFVFNLQGLLKERESSATELSSKLSESVANYRSLQDTINEKEEKISILANQSELALKAQNIKLEQVNELSQKLLDARSKLAEKQALIEQLKKSSDLAERRESRKSSTIAIDTSNGVSNHIGSEYDDLKAALKAADSQVSEFSNIARSAEEALMRATESFDQYKTSTDEKLRSLEEEKSDLNNQIQESKNSADSLNKELQELQKQHTQTVQDLTTKLQENSLKANSFDEMKADYEKKIEVLQNDLRNQVSVSDDLQNRYSEKLREAELLTMQATQQKEEIAKLQEAAEKNAREVQMIKDALQSKDDSLAEKYSAVQEELQVAQIQVKDLQYQYDLAINQLELQKSSTTDENSDENMRQVVNFLRSEKEAAEANSTRLTDEMSKLRSDLENVTVELNASRSQISRLQSMKMELEGSKKEHNQMLEQIEQLNILRESNTTLRNEIEQWRDRFTQLEGTLRDLKENASTDNPESFKEVHEQELKLVKEENDRLKNQLNNNEELKNLMQRFENLKAEFKTKLSGHRNKNRELEKQLNEVKQGLESSQKELSDLKSKGTSSEAVESLQAKLASTEKAKADAEKRFEESVASLKKDFENQKAQMESKFNSQLKQATSTASSASDSSLKANLEAEWKSKLDKAVSDLKSKHEKDIESSVQKRVEERLKDSSNSSSEDVEKLRKSLTSEYEDKIQKINADFEQKLEKEKQAVEKAVDRKYEFKLKVLNRKLEKLESKSTGPGAKSAGSSNSSPAPDNGSNASAPQESKGQPAAAGSSFASAANPFAQSGQFNSSFSAFQPKPASESGSGAQNEEDSVENENGKRPAFLNQPSFNFKRPKE